MRTIFKYLIYLVSLILFLLILLPKENIYFKIEQVLENQGVVISNEIFNNKLLGFDINAADVFYKELYFSNINRFDFQTYIISSKVKMDGIRFSNGFSKMIPTPIENITLTHSIFDFKHVKIDGNSSFGKLDGNIDLLSRKIILYFDATNSMKSRYSNVLRMMKQKDGRYIYEYNY